MVDLAEPFVDAKHRFLLIKLTSWYHFLLKSLIVIHSATPWGFP